jgi:2-iminobutanoate/2-iminopropanoate deaminase
MRREIVSSTRAPQAIGPYSQAVRVGKFLITSGQIPIDPGTDQLVGNDIRAATRQVMDNLKAVLEAGGSSLDQVIKTTVYLANLDDFPAMNEVYASYFPGDPPARSTIQAARLPKGAIIEIDAIALGE